MFERNVLMLFAHAHEVERDVDRGSPEIAFGVLQPACGGTAPCETQENCLKYILCIRRVAGDAVGGAEY